MQARYKRLWEYLGIGRDQPLNTCFRKLLYRVANFFYDEEEDAPETIESEAYAAMLSWWVVARSTREQLELEDKIEVLTKGRVEAEGKLAPITGRLADTPW